MQGKGFRRACGVFTLKTIRTEPVFLQNSPPVRSPRAGRVSPKHAASSFLCGRGPRAWGPPFETQRRTLSSGLGTAARGCGAPGASAPGSGRSQAPRSHRHLSAQRISGHAGALGPVKASPSLGASQGPPPSRPPRIGNSGPSVPRSGLCGIRLRSFPPGSA